MGSHRGNRLYQGKAQMAYQRARASYAHDQDQIQDYFGWAATNSRRRTVPKVVVRGHPTLPTKPLPRQEKPIVLHTPSASKEPAPGPGRDHGATNPVSIPIPTLHPKHKWFPPPRRERFSYTRLACGFMLGTAAGLLALWLIDAASR